MDDKFRPLDAPSDDDSTQTIELTELFNRDLTTTGSFDVGGGIWKTTFGKVAQALPIPTLLVDESFHIVLANQAWKRVSPEYEVTQGLLVSKLFPEASVAAKVQSLLEDVFSTRKPVVARGTLQVGDSRIWARMTFRSIRVMEERFILLLVEDLTASKQIVEQNRKHREELEKRVEERTSELMAANAQLREEVVERKRMEMALRESEERYRILVENSLTGIFVHQDGKFVYMNRRASESLGYSENELIGKSVWDLVAPEDREMTRGRVSARLQGEKAPSHYQVRVLTRNGEIRWIEALATEIEHNGRPATLANVVDITDRKHAEEALRESEALLRSTQQIARIGSWQLDLTTNRLTWSDEVYRIFGVESHEFSATYEGFLERVHPDDRAAVDAVYSASVREGRDSYEIEHRIVTKDSGEVRHVHEKCGHFRDSIGSIIRSVGMVQDITERKEAEKALRESEERFRNYFVTSRDCVFITTVDGKFIDANDATLETFGYDLGEKDQFMQRDVSSLYTNPEERKIHTELISVVGFAKDYPADLQKKDGTIMHCLITTVARRDLQGTVVGFQGTIRDITEHKKAEEDRERLIEQLQQALAEIKKLSGFLPICASCKKIRDDKGYWRQIERYISDHSEALFSHGICPDCAKKLYPDVFADDSTRHKGVPK